MDERVGALIARARRAALERPLSGGPISDALRRRLDHGGTSLDREAAQALDEAQAQLVALAQQVLAAEQGQAEAESRLAALRAVHGASASQW
jgi:hypothetical protein